MATTQCTKSRYFICFSTLAVTRGSLHVRQQCLFTIARRADLSITRISGFYFHKLCPLGIISVSWMCLQTQKITYTNSQTQNNLLLAIQIFVQSEDRTRDTKCSSQSPRHCTNLPIYIGHNSPVRDDRLIPVQHEMGLLENWVGHILVIRQAQNPQVYTSK